MISSILAWLVPYVNVKTEQRVNNRGISLAETGGLGDFHPVEMLQDQAQCILGEYVRSRHPRQPTRFGRLLLAIPLLRMIRPVTVENFFFRDTVGDASVIRDDAYMTSALFII